MISVKFECLIFHFPPPSFIKKIIPRPGGAILQNIHPCYSTIKE